METHPLSALLLVLVLSIPTVCGKESTVTVSCPENQKAYNGSCYEFVTLQRSFFNAQAECERNHGHLAFIHNEETQQFLQKHLQPEHNWWLGLASESFSLSSPSSEGEMVFIMLGRSSPTRHFCADTETKHAALLSHHATEIHNM